MKKPLDFIKDYIPENCIWEENLSNCPIRYIEIAMNEYAKYSIAEQHKRLHELIAKQDLDIDMLQQENNRLKQAIS